MKHLIQINVNAAKAILLCVSKKDHRNELLNVFVDLEHKTLFSTDGHRALILKLGEFVQTDLTSSEINFDVILPSADLSKFLKLLPRGTERFSLFVDDDGSIEFLSGDISYKSRLIEGRFPSWKRVYPRFRENTQQGALCYVDSQYLADIAKISKLLPSERVVLMQADEDPHRIVLFNLNKGMAHYLVMPMRFKSEGDLISYYL